MGKKPSRTRRNNWTQQFGRTPEGILGMRIGMFFAEIGGLSYVS